MKTIFTRFTLSATLFLLVAGCDSVSYDTHKPTITLLGDANVALTVGEVYTDAGATAWDDVDGNLTSKIHVVSDVNNSREGNYTVTYNVSDKAGNSADTIARHVVVAKKNTPLIPLKRIFILGSSTVHAANYISGNFNDPYGSNRKLEGWGEHLKYYLKDPGKVYNRARSGADSIAYREPDPAHGNEVGFKDRYWGFTETLIHDTDDSNGGFLMIQFGANDQANHRSEEAFKNELKSYIADAKRLGLIPVLLSPPNHRNHHASRLYTPFIDDVAKAEDVLYLDLNTKSRSVWNDYSVNEDYNGDGIDDNVYNETLPEADILYGYLEYHRGINNAHLSPIGANIVAGWVKELACQSDRDDAKLLCSQFLEERKMPNEVPPVIAVKGTAVIDVNLHMPYVEKGATASDDIDGDISANIVTTGSVDTDRPGTYTVTYSVSDSSNNEANTTRTVNVINTNAETVTVHEDAEDGNKDRWHKYGNTDSTIDNVVDAVRGGRVIELSGNAGIDNGFYLPMTPEVTSGFVTSWAMNFNADFKIFIRVQTQNNGVIFLTYVPEDIDRGYVEENGLKYAYFALGSDANNGTWKTFTRDIVADLHMAQKDFVITRILSFNVRGSGRIDDISTSTRAAKETFAYGGHTYKIVKTANTWQAASDTAHAEGGYLANIGSIAENHEIYSRLYRFIAKSEYTSTRAINGGDASYVWIGANDVDTEGTWVWENNAQAFWSGIRDGNVLNGLYNNWGRSTSEAQMEPDNAGNVQDAAGIAITEWQLGSGNLGQASQWNDLNGDSRLYYIVEYTN